MKSTVFGVFLFGVLFPAMVSAETLIVKEHRWKQGFAHSVQVNDTSSCVNGAKNLSNGYKHSDYRYISSDQFFIVDYKCMNEHGGITASSTLYQLPHSKDGEMCLTWSEWNGFILDSEKCTKEDFETRSVEVKNLSLRDYLKKRIEK